MTFSTLLLPEDNQGIGVAFTNRLGGVSKPPFDSLNFSIGVDSDDAVLKNFSLLTKQTTCSRIAITAQFHGADAVWVDEDFTFLCGNSFGENSAEYTCAADAMVTTMRGVGLAIRVADCVPVLLADVQHGIVAAAHAGRVGLLGGIIENTVAAMREHGADRITAWVGPHICARCYEVPEYMASEAWKRIPQTKGESVKGTPAIDLGQGVRAILDGQGVTAAMYDPCTSCDPMFFSYRRDTAGTGEGQPRLTGRQVGIIWLQ